VSRGPYVPLSARVIKDWTCPSKCCEGLEPCRPGHGSEWFHRCSLCGEYPELSGRLAIKIKRGAGHETGVNSAGWYKADLSKLIQQLDAYWCDCPVLW
jgi:hypothetical protein